MNGRQRIQQFLVGIILAGIIGCGPAHPVYLGSQGQIDKHYIKSATRIEYPDTEVDSYQDVLQSMEPYTVGNPEIEREFHDLTLEEAICITMQNSRILRTLSGVSFGSSGIQGAPQALLTAPSSVATVYDVSLVETDPRYGVEAALSAFDAQLKSSLGWSYENRGALNRADATRLDTGTFQTSIQKTSATGGTFFVTNGNNYYEGTTRSPQWTTYLEGGFSQPLLQGRGVQFNRIAGPGAISGFYNGVAIARVNTDSSIADFEIATKNMVYDVERAYWSLYYAYHWLESVKEGYFSTQKTWSVVNNKAMIGGREGTAQAEAQARNQYFLFRSRAEAAQSNLFKAEGALRYIMGISPTDGRLLRPSSEPTLAPLKLNWSETLIEAMARSPELRKQKWDVKKKELELLASKNFLLPQLNLNASYRVNGVGSDWISASSGNGSAFGSMTSDGYNDWQAGLSFSHNIGNRKESAGVRNAQLALARSQSILQQQELELVHQLSDAFREIAKYYQLAETGHQRVISSKGEVDTVNNAYEAGLSSIDQLLDAQRRLAEAETEFYDNVVQYNIALSDLHRRKGSLLEYNNVYLAEGPWPNKAYYDARELARKRDAGHYMNYGYTRPQVFSRGEYQQFQGLNNIPDQWTDYEYDNAPMMQQNEQENGSQQQQNVQPTPAPPMDAAMFPELHSEFFETTYNQPMQEQPTQIQPTLQAQPLVHNQAMYNQAVYNQPVQGQVMRSSSQGNTALNYVASSQPMYPTSLQQVAYPQNVGQNNRYGTVNNAVYNAPVSLQNTTQQNVTQYTGSQQYRQ